MKKSMLSLVLLVIMLVCSEGSVLASPKAIFKETRYHAGDINQGTIIVHAFAFRNAGNEPLTVKVDDCGCGGLKFTTPVAPIKPGKTGTISVSIPTINRKGNYKRDIKILTNDPAKKEFLLSIMGNIIETISIVPQYINFGEIKKGSTNKKEIIIANTGKKPFTILYIDIDPKGVAAIAPSLNNVTLRPGDKKKIEISLNQTTGNGYLQGTVSIKTNKKNLNENKIIIRAEINSNEKE